MLRDLIQLVVNNLSLHFSIGEHVDDGQRFKIGRHGVQNQCLPIGLIRDTLNTCRFFLQRQGAPFQHIR